MEELFTMTDEDVYAIKCDKNGVNTPTQSDLDQDHTDMQSRSEILPLNGDQLDGSTNNQ